MNSVCISGKVVFDPLFKTYGENKEVANFIVSVKDSGSFNIDAWGKLAIYIKENIKKDSYIAISGKLKQDRWKEEETYKEKTKIVAIAIEVIENRLEPPNPLEDITDDFDSDPF